ncbi:MAG TPA: hypothetical protein VGK25_10770 [Ignavibacteria bacterium]|jgi:hypothetical protein
MLPRPLGRGRKDTPEPGFSPETKKNEAVNFKQLLDSRLRLPAALVGFRQQAGGNDN